MCYHAEFGRSTSNGVGLNRGEPKNWRDAGAPTAWDGAWLTLKANPLKLAVSYTVVAIIIGWCHIHTRWASGQMTFGGGGLFAHPMFSQIITAIGKTV